MSRFSQLVQDEILEKISRHAMKLNNSEFIAPMEQLFITGKDQQERSILRRTGNQIKVPRFLMQQFRSLMADGVVYTEQR
jgi:hypothetical protein